MRKQKFARQDSSRFSKLGKKRKKLQKWRKPKGRDSKMREKRKSYPKNVSVGFKKPKKNSGLIEGKRLTRVNNMGDLKNIKQNNIILIGNMGARKRIEIIKAARESNLIIYNLGGIKKDAIR